MKEVNYLLNLLISYTDKYSQSSIIREFIQEIESYSDFDQVILCEKIRNQDCFISKCLNFYNCMIDVCIFFCSEEARNTVEMCEEVNLAFYSGLKIIPIYKIFSDTFPLIRHKKGVKVVEDMFNPQDVVKDVINILRTERKGEISN